MINCYLCWKLTENWDQVVNWRMFLNVCTRSAGGKIFYFDNRLIFAMLNLDVQCSGSEMFINYFCSRIHPVFFHKKGKNSRKSSKNLKTNKMMLNETWQKNSNSSVGKWQSENCFRPILEVSAPHQLIAKIQGLDCNELLKQQWVVTTLNTSAASPAQKSTRGSVLWNWYWYSLTIVTHQHATRMKLSWTLSNV
jgi:hypothetical protein